MTCPLVAAARSLSGGPLSGSKIVRLVYMDEAGISNPAHEPFVVVSGIIVNADKNLINVERRLQGLIDRHIPEEHRAGFIFHAQELFNGGGEVFQRDRWPLQTRLEIARDLANLPRKCGLPIAYGFRERANVPQSMRDMFGPTVDSTTIVHVMAFMSCAMTVEQWMRANAPQEVCLIVIEDNQRAKKLITEQQHQQQDQKLRDTLPENLRVHFPFRKIKEIPLFASKQQSPVLQLADFCAYVFKRILMKDRRYDDVWEPMRRHIAVVDLPPLKSS